MNKYLIAILLILSLGLTGCSRNTAPVDCSDSIAKFDDLFNDPYNSSEEYVVAVAELADYRTNLATPASGGGGSMATVAFLSFSGNDSENMIIKADRAEMFPGINKSSIGQHYKIYFNLTKGRDASKYYVDQNVGMTPVAVLLGSFVKAEIIYCK